MFMLWLPFVWFQPRNHCMLQMSIPNRYQSKRSKRHILHSKNIQFQKLLLFLKHHWVLHLPTSPASFPAVCSITAFNSLVYRYIVFNILHISYLSDVLVATRRCVSRLKDMTSEEIVDFFMTVCKCQRLLEEYYKTTSSTVTVQDGQFAGQTVRVINMTKCILLNWWPRNETITNIWVKHNRIKI